MSFENFFTNRYPIAVSEIEEAIKKVEKMGGSEALHFTTFRMVVEKVGNKTFIISNTLQRAFEINEKIVGGVATKILQLMWEYSKKN